jgi:hypothetical protein
VILKGLAGAPVRPELRASAMSKTATDFMR